MTEVGFSLGSNIGDRVMVISQALKRLFETPELAFVAASSFYETPPWGYEDQAPFVNACAAGRTRLSPRRLIAACKAVEQALGRQETFRWGPRVIDIDVLYYDGEEVVEPDLAIPHKELFNRAFVLRPLAEIRPDLVLSGRRIADEAGRFAGEDMPVVAPPWAPSPD
jgi:2-amino-4-hydroxy-6-hydroxymethyldihydropteridine diphosphokinase